MKVFLGTSRWKFPSKMAAAQPVYTRDVSTPAGVAVPGGEGCVVYCPEALPRCDLWLGEKPLEVDLWYFCGPTEMEEAIRGWD